MESTSVRGCGGLLRRLLLCGVIEAVNGPGVDGRSGRICVVWGEDHIGEIPEPRLLLWDLLHGHAREGAVRVDLRKGVCRAHVVQAIEGAR